MIVVINHVPIMVTVGRDEASHIIVGVCDIGLAVKDAFGID